MVSQPYNCFFSPVGRPYKHQIFYLKIRLVDSFSPFLTLRSPRERTRRERRKILRLYNRERSERFFRILKSPREQCWEFFNFRLRSGSQLSPFSFSGSALLPAPDNFISRLRSGSQLSPFSNSAPGSALQKELGSRLPSLI